MVTENLDLTAAVGRPRALVSIVFAQLMREPSAESRRGRQLVEPPPGPVGRGRLLPVISDIARFQHPVQRSPDCYVWSAPQNELHSARTSY